MSVVSHLYREQKLNSSIFYLFLSGPPRRKGGRRWTSLTLLLPLLIDLLRPF